MNIHKLSIDSNKMPVVFIGHGSPMNAIEQTPFAMAWSEQAKRIPRPEAILCISAHWETNGSKITAMSRPRTIHDFYGFPEELYRVEYPAFGSSELVRRVLELAGSQLVAPDQSWGLDHGTWSVMRRMYPEADIPVVQLSLDRKGSPSEHVALARNLRPLRDEGILVVGSGNLVHNLPVMRWDDDRPYPWAEEFDELAAELIQTGEIERLIAYPELGEAAQRSIPTNEHFLPALYALALRDPNELVEFFTETIVFGSVSMRSFRIG